MTFIRYVLRNNWFIGMMISCLIMIGFTYLTQTPSFSLIKKKTFNQITLLTFNTKASSKAIKEKILFSDFQILFQPALSKTLELPIEYKLNTLPTQQITYTINTIHNIQPPLEIHNELPILKALYQHFQKNFSEEPSQTNPHINSILISINYPTATPHITTHTTPAPLNYLLWKPTHYLLEYANGFLIGPPMPISKSLSNEINQSLMRVIENTYPTEPNGYYDLIITP